MSFDNKKTQEKLHAILADLLRHEDNSYCVECDAKGPRWASFSLGVFFCMRCAGIHRNLGVHISRVKSVNLDSWTPEQVAMMLEMGNSRARAVYEALLPEGFRRPNTSAQLEQFIRSKYEAKKYLPRDWVSPKPSVAAVEKMLQSDTKKRACRAADVKLPPPTSTASALQPPAAARPKPSPATSAALSSAAVPAPPTIVTSSSSGHSASAAPAPLIDFSAPEVAPSTGAFAFSPTPAASEQLTVSSPQSTQEASIFGSAPAESTENKAKDSIMALFGSTSAAQQPNITPGIQGQWQSSAPGVAGQPSAYWGVGNSTGTGSMYQGFGSSYPASGMTNGAWQPNAVQNNWAGMPSSNGAMISNGSMQTNFGGNMPAQMQTGSMFSGMQGSTVQGGTQINIGMQDQMIRAQGMGVANNMAQRQNMANAMYGSSGFSSTNGGQMGVNGMMPGLNAQHNGSQFNSHPMPSMQGFSNMQGTGNFAQNAVPQAAAVNQQVMNSSQQQLQSMQTQMGTMSLQTQVENLWK